MNNLFRFKNKADNFKWVIAKTLDEAKEIAVNRKFVKNVNSIKVINPPKNYINWIDVFKEQNDDVSEIYNKTGFGAVLISNSSNKWIVS